MGECISKLTVEDLAFFIVPLVHRVGFLIQLDD
jgi:hypothetical protein